MRIDFSPRFQRIPGLAIGGIANAVGGIISGIAGLKQMKEGKKILGQIGEEVVPEDILTNQRMARQMAGEGMPSQQYAQAMKNIQRQQLTALRGAQDRRGGLDALSSLQQGTNDALLGLDVADANARRQNQQQLMTINNQVGNFKNRIWERKYNYGQSLRGAGNQNLMAGIDKFIGGGGLVGYGLAGNGGGNNDAYIGAPNNTPAELIPYQRPQIGGLLPRSNYPSTRNVLIGG